MGVILAAITEKGFDSITLRTNGELPKRIANTLQRVAVMSLLKPFLSENLNVVNAFHLAESQGIVCCGRTSWGRGEQRSLQHSIELEITRRRRAGRRGRTRLRGRCLRIICRLGAGDQRGYVDGHDTGGADRC